MARPPTRLRSLPRRPPPASAPGWVAAAIGAALVVAVLALYAQTARFEFVNLDDLLFITENPPVAAGLTWDGVLWSLTARSPNWHPVTWWTHMLDVSWYGLDGGPQHWLSTIGHAANALLCFLALRALSGALWPSALVAALFALHPLRVESVAWLSERKDVVSGCCFFLTLLAYAAYARRPAWWRYGLVVLAFALGLASKTMLVTVPVLLLLLDVWPLGRFAWPGAATAPARAAPAPVWRVLAEKLPLLLLSAAASVQTVAVQRSVEAVQSLDAIPLPWRLTVAPVAAFNYLRKSVWPSDLAAMYPHPALLAGADLAAWLLPALAAGFVLTVISVAVLERARRFPYLAVGWFWYLVMLLPVSGLFQVGMQSMADRYTYLPMLGVTVMLAWGLRDLIIWRPALRRPVLVACAVVLVVLSGLSARQIPTWRNSESLYRQALAVTRDNYFAHASLGTVLRQQQRIEEAELELREALRLRPNEPFTRVQLGTLLQDSGRLAEAEEHHREALRLRPTYAQANVNLGVVLLRQQRPAEAERALLVALAQQPDHALTESNLGAALLAQDRFDDARAHLEHAIRLDPSDASAHNNLGVVLVRQGEPAAARAQFEIVLRLQPTHANARRNLTYLDTRATTAPGEEPR